MQLKNGPLSILNNSISISPSKGMHGARKDDKRKGDDQGHGRDEGGRRKGSHDNQPWKCKEWAKNMVDRMAMVVRL